MLRKDSGGLMGKEVCGCEVYQVCKQCDPVTYERLIREAQGMQNSPTQIRVTGDTPIGKYATKEFDNGIGYQRHGSPTFYALLEEMANTHSEKSHDYASNENPYGNYHFAGQVAAMFAHSPQDAGFVGRIAEKIYRLSNLESGGKTPKNESIADTERDVITIAVLWMADRRDRRLKDNREMNDAMIVNGRNARSEILRVMHYLTPKDLEQIYDAVRHRILQGHGIKSDNPIKGQQDEPADPK